MSLRYPGFLFAYLMLACSGASIGDMPAPQELATLLRHALGMPGVSYHLQANCTDNKGNRSFELFPNGVTVWNRRSQIILTEETRTSLLTTLLEQDFPGFDETYGGQAHPEISAAPARISCRVWIGIKNLEKSSVQIAGGEQSAKLLGLAADLIDQVEEHTKTAVTPNDLQDALTKLADKQLALQTLRLRFVDFPAKGSNSAGYIMRLNGGHLSRQAYAPGQEVGERSKIPLEEAQYTRLLKAIQAAQITRLSGNMWSESRVALDIQVLAHKKTILARQFSRRQPPAEDPAQQSFDELIQVMRGMTQPVARSN